MKVCQKQFSGSVKTALLFLKKDAIIINSKNIFDTMAEAGIIATLIYNPDYIIHGDQLKHAHFYNEESACLYWAIDQLVKQGVENIDSFNIATTINSDEGIKNTFDKYSIDLDKYIDLSENVKRESIEEYKVLVNRVLSLAFKRDLYRQIKRFGKNCLDVKQDNISKLSGDIYNTLNELNERYILNDDIAPLSGQVDRIWEEIKLDSKSKDSIIEPKIPMLKDYFTYSKGEVIMYVARYKQGKSAYLMNECLHHAKQGRNVAYFDTEMSTKEFMIRLLANLAQVEVMKIKQDKYTKEEKEKINNALLELKKYNIIHKYRPNWQNEDILSATKVLQYKYGLDLLIFDYIKGNEGDANTLYNYLGRKADYIKNMVAGQLKIPVITATQLNRSGEISDSDKLSRYVSTVVYWRRKNKSEMTDDWRKIGNYTMQVRTNRLGEQMIDDEYIHCVFDGNRMTIYQAPEQPKEEEVPI